MTAIELAAAILDEAKTQIQANMAQHYHTENGERWVNASGRSAKAFRVESDEHAVRLVYKGDDVAPLESIQYGTDDVPTLQEAASWREAKTRSGAVGLPSPQGIIKGIAKRGGTERFLEPQDWIIGPVIDTAVQALTEQLPKTMAKEIKTQFF
jgi:hypothetical protein